MRNSIFDQQSRLGIIIHDAGGANNILYWLQHYLQNHPDLQWNILATGPGFKVLKHLFPHQPIISDLDTLLETSNVLLTGTSWASDIEHQARKRASQKKIFHITMLDHWVNYSHRFYFQQKQYVPDQLWVVDHEAYQLAAKHYPNTPIYQMENYYFKSILTAISGIKKAPKQHQHNILYVLEPIHETWNNQFMPGEFQALHFFFSKLSDMSSKPYINIHLRPHPSEPKEKYLPWCKTLHQQNQTITVSLDDTPDIISALAWCDDVVGCETTAMALALHLKKRVFCSLPPGAREKQLPHRNIQDLKSNSTRLG